MIISNLNHLEVVSESNEIKGGIAFSDAGALALSSGRRFAATSTSTFTVASSSRWGSYAGAGSSSSSVAY
jgi:hypothetical protein